MAEIIDERSAKAFLKLSPDELNEYREKEQLKHKNCTPRSFEQFFLLQLLCDLQYLREDYEDALRTFERVLGSALEDSLVDLFVRGLERHRFIQEYVLLGLNKSLKRALKCLKWLEQEGLSWWDNCLEARTKIYAVGHEMTDGQFAQLCVPEFDKISRQCRQKVRKSNEFHETAAKNAGKQKDDKDLEDAFSRIKELDEAQLEKMIRDSRNENGRSKDDKSGYTKGSSRPGFSSVSSINLALEEEEEDEDDFDWSLEEPDGEANNVGGNRISEASVQRGLASTEKTLNLPSLASLDEEDFEKLLDQFRFKCKTCGKNLGNPTKLRDHVNRVHGRVSNGDKATSCDVCSTSFATTADLERHKLSRHYITSFPCQLCRRVFRAKAELTWHVRNAHPQEITGNSSIKVEYLANGGGDSCVQQQEASAARQKRKRKPYPREVCTFCGTMVPKRFLRYHMNRHTGERPYKCKLCPKAFTSPTNLSVHSDVHIERTFLCPLCGKLFNTRATLRTHKRLIHHNRSAVKSEEEPAS